MTAQTAVERPVPLRRNRNFHLLWGGSAGSFLGAELLAVAYPLAILLTTGSAAQAGLFGVVQTVCKAAFALPAGSVVDRYSPRPVFLVADAGRLVAAGSIAVALATGAPTTAHLMAAAVVGGACHPFVGTARKVMVRLVVPPEQLTAALATEEVRTNAAALTGPPVGGLLAGLHLAAPFAVGTAATLLSWVSGLLVRLPGRPSPRAPGGPGSMFAGLRLIWADPPVRAVLAQMSLINIAAAPVPLLVIVLLVDRGAAPSTVGVVLAGGAVGALAGTALVRPLCRLRPGPLMTVVPLLVAAVYAGLALPWGPVWAAGMLFASMLGIPALRVVVDVVVLAPVPDDHRGRVFGALILILCLTFPIGFGVTTVLLPVLSASTVLLVLVGVLTVSTATMAARSALPDARWPDR